ncbi:hypothetical protein [Capnocytophaga canimorsus]|uniref:hypothetical protein n=1 Tax=Capnocytophaga canimorsus TaxID=28188 RepID=UPI0037D85C46
MFRKVKNNSFTHYFYPYGKNWSINNEPILVSLTGRIFKKGEIYESKFCDAIEVIDVNGFLHYAYEDELIKA